MRLALNNACNPAEASIEAVLPGVHDRLAALQNAVEGTRTTLTERLTSLSTDLRSHVNEMTTSTRLELATNFATMAASLVEGAGKQAEKQAEKQAVAVPISTTERVGCTSDFDRVQGHRMSRQPVSIKRLYHEYYGLEYYCNVPIEGGIAAAERLFKNSWRKNYIGGEVQHVSRVQRIIKAVDDMVEGGAELWKVLDIFEDMFRAESNSLSRMINTLKAKGLITSSRSTRVAGSSS
jgi:hypothetical protein